MTSSALELSRVQESTMNHRAVDPPVEAITMVEVHKVIGINVIDSVRQ